MTEKIVVRDLGARGPKGTSVLYGHGAPINSKGLTGDYYIDKDTQYLYGPKSSGAWDLNSFIVLGAGPQGPQGPAGKDGTSVNILGEYNSLQELQSAHPQGNMGDAYLIAGDLYVWSGSSWVNVGNIQGPQGPQGPQGIVGPVGPQGPQGLQGLKGDKGDVGPQGPRGDVGIDGPMGVPGPQGPKGDKGAGFEPRKLIVTAPFNQVAILQTEDNIPFSDAWAFGTNVKVSSWTNRNSFITGTIQSGGAGENYVVVTIEYNNISGMMPAEVVIELTGLMGLQGPQGLQGPEGPKGEQGLQGVKGDQGLVGPTGLQGPQGLQGPIGNTGPEGPKGDKGDKGSDGTSVTILGTYVSLSALQQAHPTGNAGDSYLIDGDLYVWSGSSWVNVGHIQGPVGDPGPMGMPGPEGPQGNIGPEGPQGPQGNTGPQGPQGNTGPQGLQGPRGFGAFEYSVNRVADNQYTVGEIIFYNNSYWVCLANNDAIAPIGGAIGVYWNPYSFVGAQGPQGPQGTTNIIVQQVDAQGNPTASVDGITTLQFDQDSGFEVINPGLGIAKVQMNSTFKYWQVDGVHKLTAVGLDSLNLISGTGIQITADGNSDPQSVTISAVQQPANVFTMLTGKPATPPDGFFYFDTTDFVLRTYINSTWYDLAGPGTLLKHTHNYDGQVNSVQFNQYFNGDTTPPSEIIIDGGTASTTVFSTSYDGGSASTTIFDITIDGGDAGSANNVIVDGGSASSSNYTNIYDGGTANTTQFDVIIDGGFAGQSSSEVIDGGLAPTDNYTTTYDGGNASSTAFYNTIDGGDAGGMLYVLYDGGNANAIATSTIDGGTSSTTIFDNVII